MDELISPAGGGGNPEQSQQQQKSQEEQLQQQKERQEDFKNQVLNQVLDQQARARLATLSLAKPEKAQAVESLLINMARMGRLGSKIGEAQLIDILEKVGSGGGVGMNPMGGGSGGGGTTVNFSRRRTNIDDSDDDDEYNKIMEDL